MRKRPLSRRLRPVLAVLLLWLAAGVAGAAPGPTGPPKLLGLRVSNGGKPFAGDGPLLATVSPNRDGLRDRAIVRFFLDRAARVELQVVTTNEADQPTRTISRIRRSFTAGPHTMVWKPRRNTPERTYLLRFVLMGHGSGVRVYGFEPPRRERKTSGLVVRILGVEASFLQRSYTRGSPATLSIATDTRRIRLQLLSLANVANPTVRDLKTGGIAVAPAVELNWRRHQGAPHRVQIATSLDEPSGLYFVRATAEDGRVGYAPLILRPRALGEHRIAVVLPTNTWQAYNFDDQSGDGWGDSWYVGSATRAVDLRRPYLDDGVPYRFRDSDLNFISWLRRTGKEVDYLSDDDLGRVSDGAALRRAYSLVVFPDHEEYATKHVYDVVQQYRNLGGHLIFLSAGNFLWNAQRAGQLLRRVQLWRRLGRPEAGLVGVQYGADTAAPPRQAYTVVGAESAPWAFAGTGFVNGSRFGRYGLEIDARTGVSPPGTLVLARAPDAIGKSDAEMTYYETAGGAKVFASGALSFPGSLDNSQVSRLLDNVWAHLTP
jgi:hypothetical protein